MPFVNHVKSQIQDWIIAIMPNNNLFSTTPVTPTADTVNAAGGLAYSMDPKEALAQLACTGTFHDTFYVGAEHQMVEFLKLAMQCDTDFLVSLALYARHSVFMKDTPAVIMAILMRRDSAKFSRLFPYVIDNGRMLRTFCQIVRSGATSPEGSRSFGTVGKRAVRQWLNRRPLNQLFNDAIGESPSISDVIAMVHPKASKKDRTAMFAYLRENTKNVVSEELPESVRQFEAFKAATPEERAKMEVPNVNFQRLSNFDLTEDQWKKVAERMPWQTLRMNLNTLARHGVFKDEYLTTALAGLLRNEHTIRSSKALPFQLFAAWKMTTVNQDIPATITNALHDAMEVATENVPDLSNKSIAVAVDFSGSMRVPVTGDRGSGSTYITCNDVGALIASCLIRKAKQCQVYRFATHAHKLDIDQKNTVMENASKIAANGGGTDCGVVVRCLLEERKSVDVVFVISDTESWVSNSPSVTSLQKAWEGYKTKVNPRAKLVVVDLAANTTSQLAPTKTNKEDTFHVGGWSDAAFQAVNQWLNGNTKNGWVGRILEHKLEQNYELPTTVLRPVAPPLPVTTR